MPTEHYQQDNRTFAEFDAWKYQMIEILSNSLKLLWYAVSGEIMLSAAIFLKSML